MVMILAMQIGFAQQGADSICNAPMITLGSPILGSNTSATGGELADAEFQSNVFGGSVWFAFTAPVTGRVSISTDFSGTNFDTEIVLLFACEEDCDGEYAVLDWSDDIVVLTNDRSSIDVDNLIAGRTYYLGLDGGCDGLFCSGAGNYELLVSSETGNPAPANSILCDATDMGVLGLGSVAIDFASSNEHISDNWEYVGGCDVPVYPYSIEDILWYRFTTSSNGYTRVAVDCNDATCVLDYVLYQVNPNNPGSCDTADITLAYASGQTFGDDENDYVCGNNPLNPNVEYILGVDREQISLTTGIVTVTLSDLDGGNDNIADARYLTLDSVAWGSNYCATTEVAEPLPAVAADMFSSVWYAFVAPDSGYVRVSFENVGYNMEYAIYSSINGSDSIADLDDQLEAGAAPSGATTQVDLRCLVPGKTYYVQIEGLTNETGSFQIRAIYIDGNQAGAGNSPCDPIPYTISPAPGGCADGTLGNYINYSNVGYFDAGEITPGLTPPSCGNYTCGDIWFEVQIPPTGVFRAIIDDEVCAGGGINLCFEGAMAAYMGSSTPSTGLNCTASLTEIACNQDGGLLDDASLEISGTPGDPVLIRVWDFDSDDWDLFGLCIKERCGADNCESALDISDGAYHCGDMAYTLTSLDDPIPGGCILGWESTVWYSFIAGDTTAIIRLQNIDCDDQGDDAIQFAVYPQDSLSCQGASADGEPIFSQCDVFDNDSVPIVPAEQLFTVPGLTVGETYFIVVDGQTNLPSISECSFEIAVEAGELDITCTRDVFEPNDTIIDAAPLPIHGVHKNAQICEAGDEDWYIVYVNPDKNNNAIKLLDLPADYDLEIYRPDFSQLTSSNQTGLGDEIIVLNDIALPYYYIRVFGAAPDQYSNEGYILYAHQRNQEFISVVRDTNEGAQNIADELTVDNFFSFNLYPNPTNGSVTLAVNHTENTNLKLNIKDILGKTVLSQSWDVQKGLQERQLDLTNLPTGSYIVELKGHNITEYKRLQISR